MTRLRGAGSPFFRPSLIRWVCGKSVRSHMVDGKEVVRPTAIAVVGLSNKEGRPSFRVARKMVRMCARPSRGVWSFCAHWTA